MAISLFTQLMNELKGDNLSRIASALGETPAQTKSALGGALPALIGGLASNASTTSQAAGLLEVIKRNNLDSATFADAYSAFNAPGGLTGLINMGRPLMDSLFGGRAGSIADVMTARHGISRSSASTLLNLALPIVLGMIAKRMKSAGWSASNLMTFFDQQRSSLPDTGLPAAVNPDLDYIDADERGAPYSGSYKREPMHTGPAVHAYEAAPKRGNSWLWTLPLLFLIPLVGYFFARGDEPRRIAETIPAPQVAIPRTPMPEPAKPVGTSGVPPAAFREVGLYRLEFQSGSSSITPASENELRDIAGVLSTNPQAYAEVNGYTDNVGDDAANVKVSQARAKAITNVLVRFGVDRSRVRAQGYGEANPVADNVTAEGRQRNRRVEIHVANR